MQNQNIANVYRCTYVLASITIEAIRKGTTDIQYRDTAQSWANTDHFDICRLAIFKATAVLVRVRIQILKLNHSLILPFCFSLLPFGVAICCCCCCVL